MDDSRDTVAIVGLGCLFPGAASADDLWRNVCDGVDAIGEVPTDRWDPVFYEPDAALNGRAGERFYCRRGGFVDDLASFDPTAFRVMPIAVDGGEPDQFLALAQAAAALEDSGHADQRVPADRVGVVVGRGAYRTPGVARLDQRVHVAQQLVEAVRALVPGIDAERLAQVRAEFVTQLGPLRTEASIGLVPNLAASRIANRFDFQGPAYTLDAACASGLLAVDHARRELLSGRCDLVLAGATHHCHDVTLWSVFTQLQALSPSERIRPFSRHADGILIGEGTAFFVLRRLADAERDGDRVYAVVRGCGVASDGRAASLMSPSVAGQVLAMDRAWRDADLDPTTVGLVEAHGTGTPVGDEAELASLRQVFGPADDRRRAGLGSIKSMIGHAMPAAGAAGLAKAALAVHHGVLPPTLHAADDPHPLVDQTRFRLLSQAEPWESARQARRAGVSAFGFGGINAHLVLEAHPASAARARPRRARPRDATSARPEPSLPSALLVAGTSPDDVRARLDRIPASPSLLAGPVGDGPARLAVVDVTPRRLELARTVVQQGRPWRGRNGVWFEPQGLLTDGGQLAFVFPGVEPTFEPRIDDVAEHFGLERLAAPLRDLGRDMPAIERQARGIIAVGRLLHRALGELGIAPDMVAGHSLGEWTGEVAAGVLADDVLDDFLGGLAPGAIELADVVFLALACGAERATGLIAGLPTTAVSHDNCPHQSVVCGPPTEIATVVERAASGRILAQELPFRSGFHAPAFADHIPRLRDTLGALPMRPPSVPLWSATTGAPYPVDPEEMRALAARHLVEPVRFRELVLAMHEAGARVFVQVGVGRVTGFVDDTLQDRPAMTVAANHARRSGLEQLVHLAAGVWVEGRDVAFERFGRPQPGGAGARRAQKLDLGTRLIRQLTPLANPGAGAEPAEPVVETVRFSLDNEPAYADHAFFRQADGWPHPEDRFPLVPMTGLVEVLRDAAQELRPNLVPVRLDDVSAQRWLTVEPPTDVTVRASEVARLADGTVQVSASIDGHARATVWLAPDYPRPPEAPPPALTNERPSHIDSDRFYPERHMFHGPAYQGVRELLAVADDGSRAVLEARPAPGSLLDCAGQLMGHWLSAHAEADRLVLPTGIERVELFGPSPAPGRLVDCTLVVREMSGNDVVCDLHLSLDGRHWCVVTGWRDRRFPTDAAMFETFQWPERAGMSEERDGYTLVRDRWSDGPTRDLVMRRYLGRAERHHYEGQNLRTQRQFLLGRMAVKDAVRRWLWAHGHSPLFPAEVVVANGPGGRSLARGPYAEDLCVSLADVDGLAAAVVGNTVEVGIDVERIEPRHAEFEQMVLTSPERRLDPAEGFDDDRDAWLTCVWAIKEAAAKATGQVPGGRPEDQAIAEIRRRTARVGDRWIAFERITERKEHVVAWTLASR